MKNMIAVLGLMLATSTTWAGAPLNVENAVVRATPPGARVTASFMTLRNGGSEDVSVTAVTSPAYGRVEMHLSKVVDGVAKMIPQEQLVVPAGGELVLQHGSWHLMLFEPKASLEVGDQVQLELETSAGPMSLNAPVTAMAMHKMKMKQKAAE